jgi:hypothetical protein
MNGKNLDREQFLDDLAQAIRQQTAAFPEAEGSFHFCLNCWKPILDERCSLCSTTNYSVPMLTAKQLTMIQRSLARFN